MDFFREVFRQFTLVWNGFKTYQKLSLILIISSLIGLLALIVISEKSSNFTPLFTNEKLQLSDVSEIKNYLDHQEIPYKIESDSAILVPIKDVQKIRADLVSLGLPRTGMNKGYELFDNNTWIKGEKELQILEVRALKGQLEQDIAQFDNIRSANVILDIAPPRPFGGSLYKTKASVILTLVPGARISPSEIQAITYHVAGAVRGLAPNMVAISDTTGKLYQPWDSENATSRLDVQELLLEENLKDKIDRILSFLLGSRPFNTSVQVLMGNPEASRAPVMLTDAPISQAGMNFSSPQPILRTLGSHSADTGIQNASMAIEFPKIESISVAILIDKKGLENLGESSLSDLQREIQSQLRALVSPYQAQSSLTVNFVDLLNAPLAPKVSPDEQVKPLVDKKDLESDSKAVFFFFAALCFLLFFIAISFLTWRWRKEPLKKKTEQKKKLDEAYLERMIETLKNQVQENPKSLAIMIENLLSQKK